MVRFKKRTNMRNKTLVLDQFEQLRQTLETFRRTWKDRNQNEINHAIEHIRDKVDHISSLVSIEPDIPSEKLDSIV